MSFRWRQQSKQGGGGRGEGQKGNMAQIVYVFGKAVSNTGEKWGVGTGYGDLRAGLWSLDLIL